MASTHSLWHPLKQHFFASLQSLSKVQVSPILSHTPFLPLEGAGHVPFTPGRNPGTAIKQEHELTLYENCLMI